MTETSDFKYLLPPLDSYIENWVKEDIPNFDYGAFVVGNKYSNASLKIKSSTVLAGVNI
jgi:nicotinate-nucleotide pyrophosphorylase (carboxylating)